MINVIYVQFDAIGSPEEISIAKQPRPFLMI